MESLGRIGVSRKTGEERLTAAGQPTEWKLSHFWG
jgi:hypothetical protein